MASRDGGGSGAFGWTVLGFLAGVAATLAAETLFGGGNDHLLSPQATVTHITAIQTESAAPRPSSHPEAASSRPASTAAAESQDETADDAAAAGMTSRVQPSTDDNGAARN
jgi:hypothetical protein